MANKASRKHTQTVYYYALKYHNLLDEGFGPLQSFSKGKCRSVLEALANLSKYLGCYSRFKALKEEAGVRWGGESGLETFKRLYSAGNNSDSHLNVWIKQVRALPFHYAFPVMFQGLTGLRPSEALTSLNQISDRSG